MGILYEKVATRALFAMNPEAAHTLALRGMALLGSTGPLRAWLERSVTPAGGKPIVVAGLSFPNFVGLAAGFDKDGLGWKGAAALGFGHVEIGTATWHAQPGNEKPRVFRYPSLRAVVNRYGFPNIGSEAIARRIASGPKRGHRVAPLGINIGKSKIVDPADREAVAKDYLASFNILAPHADYVAINISSPNTPGLRTLQDRGPLLSLLSQIQKANRELAEGSRPLFLKIAPDLNPRQLDDILAVVAETSFSGIIASNTTISRPQGTEACEVTGGLSGSPLLPRALEVVRYLCKTTNGRIPVIGCGGILSAADAGRFMDEGAALVQIYSGLVFRGPALAREVAQGLAWRQLTWV